MCLNARTHLYKTYGNRLKNARARARTVSLSLLPLHVRTCALLHKPKANKVVPLSWRSRRRHAPSPEQGRDMQRRAQLENERQEANGEDAEGRWAAPGLQLN